MLLEKLTSFAANQEIPRILWNLKGYYRTHKRPPSDSSNSLFKVLPSRLHPFGLKFSIIFGILLFFLVTCGSQFDLCLLMFWSTVSASNSFKISSFLLLSNRVYPAVLLKKKIISIDINIFCLIFFLRVQISLAYKRMGTDNVYILILLKMYGTELV